MSAERIRQKASVLAILRAILTAKGFIELNTSVMRRSSSEPFPRVRLLQPEAWLRDSIEMALRYNLRFVNRIFEIGPCFRDDSIDTTHTSEFMMLELYATDFDHASIVDLSAQIFSELSPSLTMERISVADVMRKDLGVDLAKEPEEFLVDKLRVKYPQFRDKATPSYQVINHYIEKHVEPLSHARLVAFEDYPISTISSARRKPGTRSIINRVEVFYNGLEVMHGYEDEDDLSDFKARAHSVNLWNAEEQLIHESLASGSLPIRTAGLGIGIERLCVAAFLDGVGDIREFLFSHTF